MGKPHILAISYPAQGHVIPLMELALSFAKHGFKVTFVNTEFIHNRVVNALSEEDDAGELINLVSISDGRELWEDRKDLGKLSEGIFQVMPAKLEQLIKDIKETSDDEITCIIADENMGWALQVAANMGIKRAAFWPASAALLALFISIPKLLQDGVLDNDGTILKNESINLTSTMPPMKPTQFSWACLGNLEAEKIIFKLIQETNRTVKLAEWIICNTANELEPATLAAFPEILPIGPLLASHRLGKPAGNFWQQDSSCLTWLNQQAAQSVIYVAFGSFTIFDPKQFQQLAQGLELINKPFLWVVRPDMANEASIVYLKKFKARIGNRGRVVDWAPQQTVLNHPSLACFLSHCGWNSTMEGISNGLPFLCWPYFADQFLNETYICDIWKVGFRFNKDDSGIITKEEIKKKAEQLLNDETLKERVLVLKEMAVTSVKKGGVSNKNITNFIEWMKK